MFSDFKIKLLLLISLFLLTCSQRDRSNIFDPHNSDNTLKISLSVKQHTSGFELNWNLQEYSFVDSVIIYKGYNSSSQIQPVRVFSSKLNNFLDEDISPYKLVYYAISLKSNGIETPLSKNVQRIWAEDDIFVLTYYGYAIYNLSFDLQEIKNTYYINYPYYYFDIKNETIAISSPIYDQFSYLNFNDTYETQHKIIEGAGPVLFSLNTNNLFLANQEKPYTLYKFNNQFTVTDSVHTLKRKP
ncbi:MAG: hypothetical protein KAR38_05460, partial [Calditrichia bacterium]|nr:hypothetical protein [Calditrichia bacterium]